MFINNFLLLAEEAVAETVKETVKETVALGEPSTSVIMLLLAIFVLSIYVGVEIITKIPPTLHTPLMSGSNAISGITIIGALISLKADHPGWAQFLGFFAIILAMINVVGGFMVTHRMLEMFQPKNKK